MTKSYSTDLRIKVVNFVKSGHSQIEAARIFNISKDSVKRWLNKFEKYGNVSPKKRGGSKRKIDLEALKNYVESNPNMMLKDASAEFGFSMVTISRWLKQLGYCYKKKASPTWKQAKKKRENSKKR